MQNYKPNGRRRLGKPLKRLLLETETGLSRRNSSRMIMNVSGTEHLRSSETVCMYTVKYYTTVYTIGIPFIVSFTRKGREPAHKTGCGALAENVWSPLLYNLS